MVYLYHALSAAGKECDIMTRLDAYRYPWSLKMHAMIEDVMH